MKSETQIFNERVEIQKKKSHASNRVMLKWINNNKLIVLSSGIHQWTFKTASFETT